MRFSAREDIEVPADTVFAAVADFDAFQRLALRRGIEVRRLDRLKPPGVGTKWAVKGRLRGRERNAIGELWQFDPPASLILILTGGGFEARFEVLVVALSRGRSRLIADLEVRPRSIAARLLLQTARLGRSGLLRRYQGSLRRFAQRLEMAHTVRRA